MSEARLDISQELVRLIAGQTCVHACLTGLRMAAPLLALREGYSAAAVGVLLSLFALASVFLALPAGRFADRHGLKRPMAIGIGVSTLSAALAAAWPVFPVLCLSALLSGAAIGGIVIAVQRHVGRLAESPTQLRRVFSWLAIGPGVSNFVGPFCAGLLIDNGGFRWAFIFLALLPLAGWACVRHLRELPPVQVPVGTLPSTAWSLLREPMFRRLMVVNWVLSSCWDVHTFLVPVLGHERDLSATVIGALLGTFAAASIGIRLLLPMIASRVREWQVIMTSMAVAAVVFAVYPLVHSTVSMGLCSAVLGLALGAVQPMVMSTLHQITPEHRHGEALAMRLMAINGSSVMMPMLFGVAGAVIGVTGVFWVVGLAVGSSMRLASRLRLTTGRDDQSR